VIAAQRRRAILRQIRDNGYVEASRLSADLGVDVSTIRRDLDSLARSGLVQRTHGGALASGPPAADLPEAARQLVRSEAKRAIATLAAGLVADGESVALDAGSTTYALALELAAKKNLTVVTNDLRIAGELAARRRARLVVVGGELGARGCCLVGPWAQDNLAGIHVDWAFLGADGLDARAGVTSDDPADLPIKRAMLAAARATAVVADSSKFNRRALVAIAPIDEFDHLLTDEGLAAAHRAAYGPALRCAAIEEGGGVR
jgi:DeoR/GlpR family transcriptional regulator of sugar metabolism